MFDARKAQKALADHVEWARLIVNARTAVTPQSPAGLEIPDGSASPLHWLSVRFGLSQAASNALWLLAVCEIDDEIAAVVQARGRGESTPFTLASLRQVLLAVGFSLSASDFEQLSSLGLIEMEADHRVSQTRRWVRASDRVTELATGELRLDPFVSGFCAMGSASTDNTIPASMRAAIEANAFVIACGQEGSGRRTVLTAAAASIGAGSLLVDCRRLSSDHSELVRQLRAVVRECCLFSVVPLLTNLEALIDGPHGTTLQRDLLDVFEGPVLATLESTRTIQTRRSLTQVELAPPTFAERQQIWERCIPGIDPGLLARVSGYEIGPGVITKCARDARAAVGAGAITEQHLREALRGIYDQKLSALAKRVESPQSWDDLVLPPDQFEQVVEFVARVRHRGMVLDTWGFAEKAGKGNGVAALFSGPPGTGKTMAAALVVSEHLV